MSVPPRATSDQRTQVFARFEPSSLTRWMYRLSSVAPGAVMVSFLPPPCTTADGNCGLDTARKFEPLIVGYRPSDENTYQALIVPRSSLPVMPSGPVVNSVI